MLGLSSGRWQRAREVGARLTDGESDASQRDCRVGHAAPSRCVLARRVYQSRHDAQHRQSAQPVQDGDRAGIPEAEQREVRRGIQGKQPRCHDQQPEGGKMACRHVVAQQQVQ
ncbi:hypothetical protein G6F24_015261 [Rhizopus arrhizus]|nr:hypothetical protein G6F24_015261 [Rhizopus arrhizus]